MARAKTFCLMAALILCMASLSFSQTTSQVAIPDDLLITLSRSVCFGTCPDYSLTVKASGEVVFKGERYVRIVGKAKGRITPAQVRELITEFEKVNYMQLLDNYGASGNYRQTDVCPEMWTDMPTAYTSITLNGKTKTVAHYHGCMGNETLESLSTLENRIDEIVNSKQWIK